MRGVIRRTCSSPSVSITMEELASTYWGQLKSHLANDTGEAHASGTKRDTTTLLADEHAAAALATIGLPALARANVHAVRILPPSDPSSSTDDADAHAFKPSNDTASRHLIVLASGPLADALPHVRDAIRSAPYTSCTVLATFQPASSGAATASDGAPGGALKGAVTAAAFRSAEAQVSEWLADRAGSTASGTTSSVVRLLGVPPQLCALGASAFVLPLSLSSAGLLPSSALARLPTSASEVLAAQLAQLCGALRLRPEVFSLGAGTSALGRLVRGVIETEPALASSAKSASLILVDRALDLVAPSTYSTHPLELASRSSPSLLLSLAAPPLAENLFDALLPRRPQEVSQLLLKALAASANQEGVDVSLPPRASSRAVSAAAAALRAEPLASLRHAPLLSAVEALERASGAAAADEALRALESHQKSLLYAAAEDPLQVFTVLQTLASRAYSGGSAKGAGHEQQSLRQLLPLLAMGYSLLGSAALTPEASDAGSRLQHTLLQACLRARIAAGNLQEPLDEMQERLDRSLASLFTKLRDVAAARHGLGRFERLLTPDGAADAEPYHPLLRQLLERLLGGDELPELKRADRSGGTLSTGFFRRLGVGGKCKPGDAGTIILFVVGGITVRELGSLRQLSARHTRARLLVGASRMLNPSDVCDAMVCIEDLVGCSA